MRNRTMGITVKTYGYENTRWGDLLTSYRGQKIAYAGDKLVWQGWDGNEMYFFYDNTGTPIAFWYFPDGGSRVTGYYFTNQQGDVVRIEDPDGNVLASYSYNAWGKAYISTGSMRNINPLRYRGYYYDTETGFYYLQSRQPPHSCLAVCRRAYCFGVRPWLRRKARIK